MSFLKKFNSKILLSVIALFSFTVLLFAPLFFSHKILFDADTFTYDYPAFSFYHDAYASGESPLWNPYYLGGFSTVLSPVGDFIDPLNRLLLHAVDGFTALHIRLLISVLLGLIFAYLFARKSGLSPGAGIILAFTYLLAQTLSGMTAGLINSGSFFVMPMLLFILLSARTAMSTRAWISWGVLGSLLLAYGWLAGFTQTVFYSCILAFVYACYLDYSSGFPPKSFSKYKAIVSVLFVGVISALLALPFLSDTILFRPHTLRISGFGTGDIGGIGLIDFFYFFFPNYASIPFLTEKHNVGFYIGAASLVFVIIALRYFWRDRKLRFFMVTYLAVLAVLFEPLGVGRLIQALPVFSWFHSISRLLLPGAFFFVYIAAYAFDSISDASPELKVQLKKMIKLPLILTIFVLCGVVLLNIFFFILPWPDAAIQLTLLKHIFVIEGKDPTLLVAGGHYVGVFNKALHSLYATFSLKNWQLLLPLLAFPAVLLALGRFGKNKISRSFFRTTIITVVLLNVFLVYAAQFDKYIDRALANDVPAFAQYLKNKEGGNGFNYYITSFLTGDAMFRNVTSYRTLADTEQFIAARNSLSRNINVMYEVPRIDGYEPFWSGRQAHVWQNIVQNEIFNIKDPAQLSEELAKKKEEFLSMLPLLSAYNVRYIVSGYKLNDPRLMLRLTNSGSALETPSYLYENSTVLPRIHAPERLHIVNNWSDKYFKLITSHNEEVIECESCSQGLVSNNATITILGYTNTKIHVRVKTTDGAWIVIANSNVPGWLAAIDGKETDIYSANYLMQAVHVTAGSHDVTLEYIAPSGK